MNEKLETLIKTNEYWEFIFSLFCINYPPLKVLHLADGFKPAMSELYYYVKMTHEATLYCSDTGS